MTIYEFNERMIAYLERFNNHYLDRNEEDPEGWPIELDEAEWLEELKEFAEDEMDR